MLTLETGEERVYIYDGERNASYEGNELKSDSAQEEYVLVKTDDGNEMPVESMIVYPKYSGAVVVCDGGADPGIQLKVLKTVSSLTGLRADRISVQKMK